MSKNTVYNYTVLITTICKFANDIGLDQGFFNDNVMPSTKCTIKNADNPRMRTISIEECGELLQHPRVQKDENLRLFVLLALNLGARFNSILDIRKKDIDIENRTVNIRDTKRGTTYTIFLNDNIIDMVRQRYSLLKESNDHLLNINGMPLDKRSIEQKLLYILNKLFNQGLDKKDRANRVVIHTLRHTFASTLARQGVPSIQIQHMLNHASGEHTARYMKPSKGNGQEYLQNLKFSG